MATDLILGFIAGVVLAGVTAPVGVSGAVLMLPIQLSVLAVPDPAVTPTNLLYNVIAGPGALVRYRRRGQLVGPLTRLLIAGTVPGVVLGAAVRAFLLTGSDVFRMIAGVVLLVLGGWLVRRTLVPSHAVRTLSFGVVGVLAFGVGVVGGIYGIGGGSILSPILVGSGMTLAAVAPAALACTFVTSVIGTATFAVLELFTTGAVGPDWPVGIACGLGGLVGGYVGARLQPRLPERALRLVLGFLALGIGVLYVVEGLVP